MAFWHRSPDAPSSSGPGVAPHMAGAHAAPDSAVISVVAPDPNFASRERERRRFCGGPFWVMGCCGLAFFAFVLAAVAVGAADGDDEDEAPGPTTTVLASSLLGGVTVAQFQEPAVRQSYTVAMATALSTRDLDVPQVSSGPRRT